MYVKYEIPEIQIYKAGIAHFQHLGSPWPVEKSPFCFLNY